MRGRAHLVYDDDRLPQRVVELPLHELAQEEVVDVGLEAVDHLRALVVQVGRRGDTEAVEERPVGAVVALEQSLVVLEHVHLLGGVRLG